MIGKLQANLVPHRHSQGVLELSSRLAGSVGRVVHHGQSHVQAERRDDDVSVLTAAEHAVQAPGERVQALGQSERRGLHGLVEFHFTPDAEV
jgi:hypothetical protein